jgi:2-keto-4-pentenoate hydratase/2-oxohepta-3-ene-1,7-dioic acid hydratase in catechol pathway
MHFFTPCHSAEYTLFCTVDGETRQHGSAADMIFGLPRLIAEASRAMKLEPGDVILTGTPSGVGPIAPGQRVACGVEGVFTMSFQVVSRPQVE